MHFCKATFFCNDQEMNQSNKTIVKKNMIYSREENASISYIQEINELGWRRNNYFEGITFWVEVHESNYFEDQ